MNTKMYFSKDTGDSFKDYMFDYLSNVEGKKGYSYNKELKFEEKEALINKAILADVERVAGVSLQMEGIAPEVMASHPAIRFATFAVVGQLIDMIIPDVLDKSIGLYTDTRFGQFGDSFRFDIEPNDLFLVSKAGRDQRTVEFQRQYNGTQYVIPENRAITVYVNLFRVLCGLDSLAKFVMKAILSVESKITAEVFQAMNTAMGALPTTPAGGALRITAAGGVVDKLDAIRLAQAVTAFNGGAQAIFVGTKVALSHLFPDSSSGFRYTDAGISYFRNVWGVDTMEINQVANWQNKYQLRLDDTKVYVISPSSQKLVKLCYEGATTTNTVAAHDSANKTEATTLNKSYGIAIATNAVAGCIELVDESTTTTPGE